MLFNAQAQLEVNFVHHLDRTEDTVVGKLQTSIEGKKLAVEQQIREQNAIVSLSRRVSARVTGTCFQDRI